jgi:hypothetical protein
MSDRRDHLRELAEALARRDDIHDAYTAKSFTDRLFVVELSAGESVPQAVRERLTENDLQPASEVYDDDRTQTPFAGADDHDQFRFVDVQSRGELQSYVVD